MFLIVGLGNPGTEYAATRHNAGFMAVDSIAQKYDFGSWREKFDGLISEGKINGQKVCLLKPQTFMNLSGNSVIKTAAFFKILPPQIVVIHDDIDLDLTKIKAKIGGSSGGHNGLKSIDAHIGSQYNRIRLGVGHPQGTGEKVIGHVLSKFSKDELNHLHHNIQIVTDNLPLLLDEGLSAFSNRIGMLTHKEQGEKHGV